MRLVYTQDTDELNGVWFDVDGDVADVFVMLGKENIRLIKFLDRRYPAGWSNNSLYKALLVYTADRTRGMAALEREFA